VIGLGLVGQLVLRLLVAAGVRTVGVDTVPERCRMAEEAGSIASAGPDAEGAAYLEQVLDAVTGGIGADHVLLAAGGTSNGPVELAARLARDRARIVDIGKTRMDLPWNAYYEKELDLRFSRSYGPGRYDDRYELEGIDYPVGHVRWTERRNLQCFLDLISSGALDLSPLVSATYPVEQAADVYARLREGALRGVGFLFDYGQPPAEPSLPPAAAVVRAARPVLTTSRQVNGRRTGTGTGLGRIAGNDARSTTVRVGFIGAGSYATSMLLPHLAAADGVTLRAVATTRSLSSVNAQRKFGFERATTDAEAILEDPCIDAVFVVTRHHSHADFVCRALKSGKAVFVEKPLALTRDDVARISGVIGETGNDRLMVGFNRRFAPLLMGLRRQFGPPAGPMSIRYLVNAGQLAASSWYLDERLEGSRFLGEGGHFIDTVSAWIGHPPVQVTAHETVCGQDLHVVMRHADGSLAAITYATGGDVRFPKETLDISGSGRNARLDNFSRATVWSRSGKKVTRSMSQDKGQRETLRRFVEAVRGDAPMPITLESLLLTTRASIAVEESLASGRTVSP
jgi:predicted dehydrogenase